jgi:hypothetical protein
MEANPQQQSEKIASLESALLEFEKYNEVISKLSDAKSTLTSDDEKQRYDNNINKLLVNINDNLIKMDSLYSELNDDSKKQLYQNNFPIKVRDQIAKLPRVMTLGVDVEHRINIVQTFGSVIVPKVSDLLVKTQYNLITTAVGDVFGKDVSEIGNYFKDWWSKTSEQLKLPQISGADDSSSKTGSGAAEEAKIEPNEPAPPTPSGTSSDAVSPSSQPSASGTSNDSDNQSSKPQSGEKPTEETVFSKYMVGPYNPNSSMDREKMVVVKNMLKAYEAKYGKPFDISKSQDLNQMQPIANAAYKSPTYLQATKAKNQSKQVTPGLYKTKEGGIFGIGAKDKYSPTPPEIGTKSYEVIDPKTGEVTKVRRAQPVNTINVPKPGQVRVEDDGTIRRKSKFGGALGSLSNLLGDVGNTLKKQ